MRPRRAPDLPLPARSLGPLPTVPARRSNRPLVGDNPQVAQHSAYATAVSQLPPDREALLVQLAGARKVPLLDGHIPEVVERRGGAPAVAEFPRNRKALFEQGLGVSIVGLVPCEVAGGAERSRKLQCSLGKASVPSQAQVDLSRGQSCAGTSAILFDPAVRGKTRGSVPALEVAQPRLSKSASFHLKRSFGKY